MEDDEMLARRDNEAMPEASSRRKNKVSDHETLSPSGLPPVSPDAALTSLDRPLRVCRRSGASPRAKQESNSAHLNLAGKPFTLSSFPVALLHIDADAFFTSVEQAVHPKLRGKPVVTGKERGIIACASYEAKAIGVRRGIQLHEAQKMCPELVVLPSDYETYSIYSKRLFDIMRRYTPLVEEHSVDEGFADISGLRRMYHASYQKIAAQIRKRIHQELDITVSVGLSLSKGLTKLASKFRKPDGFTAVAGPYIHVFLKRIPLEEVWGFGPNTVHLLKKYGMNTAYDFACLSEKAAQDMLGKVGNETWHELRGRQIYPVVTEEKTTYATISKCKSFTSPSSDKEYVYAKLVRNLESAFIKLRRYKLRARFIAVFLRDKDFYQQGVEAKLNRSTSAPQEAIPLAKQLFESLYKNGVAYRTTVIVLGNLEEDTMEQYELFEDRLRIDKLKNVSKAIDEVNKRYGKHSLSTGSCLFMKNGTKNSRDALPWRKAHLLKGESARQRLKIPMLEMGKVMREK